jgi:1-phosphatidylinositol-5-phosphate 4-kinase
VTFNNALSCIFFFDRSQPLPDDSSGKSGAKFYQSSDKLFIIKTLTSEEVERMHSFLKHYHPVYPPKK